MESGIDQCGFYETQIPNKERLRFSGNQLYGHSSMLYNQKNHIE